MVYTAYKIAAILIKIFSTTSLTPSWEGYKLNMIFSKPLLTLYPGVGAGATVLVLLLFPVYTNLYLW